MSRSPKIIALLDANVLYPAPLRDYLLHLASLGVYEPEYIPGRAKSHQGFAKSGKKSAIIARKSAGKSKKQWIDEECCPIKVVTYVRSIV